MRTAARLPSLPVRVRPATCHLAGAVSRLLRRPGDLSAGDVRGALAFYDVHRGRLRVIVRGSEAWAEVWQSGECARRAAVHAPDDRVTVIECDRRTGRIRLVARGQAGWQDALAEL